MKTIWTCRVIFHFIKTGIYFKIPICCIISFCFEFLLQKPVEETFDGYIPCFLHRKKKNQGVYKPFDDSFKYLDKKGVEKRQLLRETHYPKLIILSKGG